MRLVGNYVYIFLICELCSILALVRLLAFLGNLYLVPWVDNLWQVKWNLDGQDFHFVSNFFLFLSVFIILWLRRQSFGMMKVNIDKKYKDQ